jgi:hypothetical protein
MSKKQGYVHSLDSIKNPNYNFSNLIKKVSKRETVQNLKIADGLIKAKCVLDIKVNPTGLWNENYLKMNLLDRSGQL